MNTETIEKPKDGRGAHFKKENQPSEQYKYFKLNMGSICLGDGETIVENGVYSLDSFNESQKEAILSKTGKTVWKPIERFHNDIGMAEDRGNAPILGYEDGLPVFGIPREEIELISKATKKDYEEFSNTSSGAKIKKSTVAPWRTSSNI
jgi:hypothetical protein